MIRNIFIPEHIKGYYLFKKKTVSFSITHTAITAVCMTLQARTKTITQVLTEAIVYEGYEAPELAISAAAQRTIKKIGSYTELIVIIDSSFAIFKELSVPLLEDEKIAQILGFELEHYLPFALSDAVFDFIITSQDLTAKHSDIFAVAFQKAKITYYSDIFIQAGARVDRFVVEAFNVFGLYTELNLQPSSTARLLVTTQDDTTTALYIEENKLKKVRILHELAQLDNENWWKALSFTFESCIQEWMGPKEIVFVGSYPQEILTKAKLLFTDTQADACSIIDIEKILGTLSITTQIAEQNSSIPLSNITAALNLPLTERFNLQPAQHQALASTSSIVNYITGACLLVLLYGAFGVHTYLQMKKLSTTSEEIKSKVLKDLKAALPTLKATSLPEAVRKAKAEISKEEDIWYSFSSQTQHSFLTYLFDLSTTIDRETLGLDLKKTTFNKNGITLEGSVRSFDAVEELIKQLKNTNLFSQVPNLQKTEFNMALTLASQGERQ